MTQTDRFWAKVDAGDEIACWRWTAFVDRGGYGKFRFNGQSRLAHRVSYELANGPIQDGMCVDHMCYNRACVNPSHLRLLTHAENLQFQQRALRDECFNGHKYTPENTYRRPSDGYRSCVICRAEHKRQFEARRRAA